MAEQSSIQWTNATVNFWTGCKKVSAGCKYCYMFRDQTRYGRDPENVKRTSPKTFNAALHWNEPKLIFTCSWSDFFIEQADEWRADAWDVIRETPHHTWQILTKRPERIMECLPPDWGDGWPNVWLGVTVEDSRSVDRMIIMKNIPAKLKFVSFEPLLESIKDRLLMDWIVDANLFNYFHWFIIGGESGNDSGDWKYRPCELLWIANLISMTHLINPLLKIFVKQLGTHLAKELHLRDRHGGDITEWPGTSFNIRQMPTIASIHPKTF